MSTETTVISPLAAEILDRHKEAAEAVASARGQIEGAFEASIRCAALVDAARAEWGHGFKRRWQEEVGLPIEEAKRLMTIHKLRDRRPDKAQLLLLGIVEPGEQEPQHRRIQDSFAWAKYVARIRDGLNTDSIKAMNPEQLAVTKATLKPLVDLYNSIA